MLIYNMLKSALFWHWTFLFLLGGAVMKCNKCGNEFSVGSICPVCGNSVVDNTGNETVAYNDEISVDISNSASKVNVYSHGTPQPQEGIFSNTAMPNQNGYSQYAPGNQMNTNMYNSQPMGTNMYNNSQPMSTNMFNNGQPMSANMYNGMQGQSQMYNGGQQYAGQQFGGQTGYAYNDNNVSISAEDTKKSKTSLIIACVSIAVAVIAIIALLVFVVFKKPDGGDDNSTTTTESSSVQTTDEPSTDEPSTGGQTTDEPTTDEPSTDNNSTNNHTNTSLSGDPVFSNDMVDMSVDSMDFDSIGNFVVKGTFYNKSSDKIGILLNTVCMDGTSVTGYTYGDAEPGDVGEWTLSIDSEQIALSDVEVITNLDVYFRYYNCESYMTVFDDSMNIKVDSVKTGDKILAKEDWIEAYSDDSCKISSVNYVVYNNVIDTYEMYIRVENKTDKCVTVLTDLANIDGESVESSGGYMTIAPNSVACSKIYWYNDSLPDECKEFKKIKFELSLVDYSTYETLTKGKVEIDTKGIKK